MKRSLWMLALPCVLVCGCSTQMTTAYQTAVRIAPSKRPDAFDVEARITQRTIRRSSSLFHSRLTTRSGVVATPKLTCKPGEPATVRACTGDTNTGVVLEAYIAKLGEKKETTCTLTLREGRRILNATSVAVPPLSP